MLAGIKATGAQVEYMRGCDYASNSLALISLFSQCKASGQQGFDAKYWNNSRAEGEPDVLRHNATPLRFSTGGATVFAPNVNLENFAAVYTSTFHANEDGQVAFYMQNQGQASISVDGRRVATGRNSNEARKVYTLDAKAGQDYEIVINYSCRSGLAALSFDLGYEEEVSVDKTIAACADAEVIIFAGGISPSLEGEEMPVSIEGFRGGDRTKIELPTAQTELVKALKAAGKKVVFVNFSGSAMGLTEVEPSCDAILQVWYGGQAGGQAVAEVLFGRVNPSGKLPVTFYRNVEQLPDFEDYNMEGHTYRFFRGQPLYPFGYGLSYSKFVYGKPRFADGRLMLSVSNRSKRDGTETVLVYINKVGDVDGPIRTLRAFQRVEVPAGSSRTVSIPLPDSAFEWWDAKSNAMRIMPGEYVVQVGEHKIKVKR
jgi:beta-glucosidase